MTDRGEPPSEVLFGLHPVTEAIEAGERTIDRVLVAREGGGRNLGRLLRAARAAGVPVTYLPREILARKVGARAVHQGVAAVVSAAAYGDAAELCAKAAADPLGLLLALDGVDDPRNLGAILRTAAATGVGGVLLGSGGSGGAVGLTPTVAKTSAGALEHLPVAREPKLPQRLAALAGIGFRIVALDPRGVVPWDAENYDRRVVLVAGGESRGARRGVLDAAHARVSLPVASGVDSLNVSVAVGVVLYEVLRQRRGMGGGRPERRKAGSAP